MNYSEETEEGRIVNSKSASLLFNIIIIWSLITSLITWLPLIRIIGKPDEYYWGILDFKGEGADGPYWIFIVGALFVITMFYSAFRAKNRKIVYVFLTIWQLIVCSIILLTITDLGFDATIKGEGWHWEFPIWILGIPALLGFFLTITWIYLDNKYRFNFIIRSWSKKNRVLLFISFVLLLLALFLFYKGTNYNWVTALAIFVTIVQLIVMVDAFKSYGKSKRDHD